MLIMKKAIEKIVRDLRTLADHLETLDLNIKQEVDEEIKNKEIVITIENVRAVLAQKSQDGKVKEVKALIQKYGAEKLTALDPSCYKDILKEAEDI